MSDWHDIPSVYIPVRTIAILLAELALDSGLIQLERHKSPASNQLLYHFCILLKLMASAGLNKNRGVSLKDFALLMEDEWLKSVPSSGIRYINP
jgi:hypothetical protein